MEKQMSVKQWVLTLILLAIPVVNIIFLIVWGFKGNNPRKNYARAMLIVFSTVIVFSVFIGMGVTIIELSSEEKTTVTIPASSEASNTNNESSDVNRQGASSPADSLIEDNKQKEKMLAQDIEILDVGLEINEKLSDDNIMVVGTLRNNSTSETYTKMVVQGNAYNEEGAILHTFEIRIDDRVPPGEIYQFDDWSINNDTDSVEIIDIYSSFPY